ncbi:MULTISPECIES: ABC transporter ATP-binding protein [unclassified Sporosarcina]|uniref:ABC transporter ATP-binding protein n=1 Tax=unclassified Sporosarcina TaxID=2647733 RepID=UPI00203FF778|nr:MULTISPECIES: oligopeptide/dipeptide ABC transporter ATP-binding protein [unclassified Sporosarcina]GKV65889.1 ABC transporter ATP-binding protein [Sporosarcina sp. NCCP-2331]GLB56014.1 ABC transporter ATP-binding protein [Sporosarcina sp. NCCP-2378]
MKTNNQELVRVENLTKHFTLGGSFLNKKQEIIRAVENLSFTVYKGETLGIVGESGCGKSTTGRLLLRLMEATSGSVFFEGENVLEYSKEQLRAKRKDFQMIFQDPYASLNPRMTVEELISEPLRTYKVQNRKERLLKLVDAVGIPKDYLTRYPHEFSGGQRQRIGIARSLALNPKFIVADEPVAALDVSIQAQIINLMKDLQDEFDLTYLFIAHDLSVIEYISDRIAVMYLGGIVELTSSERLYEKPLHPYTQALISAIPIPDPTISRDRIKLFGDIPSPMNPPAGCKFHTRCPLAQDICKQAIPELREVEPEHFVACHLVEESLL